MIYKGSCSVLGTDIAACDYAFLIKEIQRAIRTKKSLLIFPAATHSITFRFIYQKKASDLSRYDYVIPDSQWLRWSLGFLYGVWLKDRVYGPNLMLAVCREAQKQHFRIGLIGYKKTKLNGLSKQLNKLFPGIGVFEYGPAVNKATILRNKINILFVGLGSPLQEQYALSKLAGLPLVVIPVGAAFDFISGQKAQAPGFMQKTGFEWLFRLSQEPGRLWKRYLIYGPLFVVFVFSQKLNLLLYPGWLYLQRIIAIMLFILLAPLLAAIALAIWIDSPGPTIFKQKRAGKKLKPFTIYKFRTMVLGAERMQAKLSKLNEADGPVFKIADDPRFTRIGKLISRPGLDELPQLINVIKGEMALVGPRPLPLKEARKIPKEYNVRFEVLPGATSAWVVAGAHSLSFKRWMELDITYLKYRSIGTDLKIIFQTAGIILKSLVI